MARTSKRYQRRNHSSNRAKNILEGGYGDGLVPSIDDTFTEAKDVATKTVKDVANNLTTTPSFTKKVLGLLDTNITVPNLIGSTSGGGPIKKSRHSLNRTRNQIRRGLNRTRNKVRRGLNKTRTPLRTGLNRTRESRRKHRK